MMIIMQMINKRTKGKILKDYGMSDYYKYYKANNDKKISSQLFNKVISEFNSLIMNSIINDGLEFTPIALQLNFCIRKEKRIPKIKNNKLVNNVPIDWKATLNLWELDSEAKSKKILIRFLNNHTSKYIFRIKALKVGHTYANKKFYKFKPCRNFQRSLAKRIFNNTESNFDAYKTY